MKEWLIFLGIYEKAGGATGSARCLRETSPSLTIWSMGREQVTAWAGPRRPWAAFTASMMGARRSLGTTMATISRSALSSRS